MTLGGVFLVIGGIALARTGINLDNMTGKHVTVAGAGQTQLTAYLELAFGALLVLSGALPGAGRGLMSLLGVAVLTFGIVVVAQPSTFSDPLGFNRHYGIFLIVVGVSLLVSSIAAPVYRSRHSSAFQAERRLR
jgi:hypothetical protein